MFSRIVRDRSSFFDCLQQTYKPRTIAEQNAEIIDYYIDPKGFFLNYRECRFLKERIQKLFELYPITGIQYISSLTFKNSFFSDKGFECFLELLKGDTIIEHLRVFDNKPFILPPTITSYDVDVVRFSPFCSALCSNHSVVELTIGSCSFRNGGLSDLAEVIRQNTTITSLRLSNCFIDKNVPGFSNFCQALESNTTITSLNLSGNFIRDAIFEFKKILKINSSIVSLDLSMNEIKLDGMKSIAGVLKDNSSLTELKLCYNPGYFPTQLIIHNNHGYVQTTVREECLKAFAKAMEKNSSIISLSFK